MTIKCLLSDLGEASRSGGGGHKAELVIEEDEQKESDMRRDKALTELGLRTVRFRNEDVLMGLSQVVGRINELISIASRNVA